MKQVHNPVIESPAEFDERTHNSGREATQEEIDKWVREECERDVLEDKTEAIREGRSQPKRVIKFDRW